MKRIIYADITVADRLFTVLIFRKLKFWMFGEK